MQKFWDSQRLIERMCISRICLHILVDSQVVRHCTLTATFVGSTPTPPANKKWRMGMELHKLYKGRYLIALYDEDDMLVDVGLNPLDLFTCENRPRSLYENISRGRDGIFGYTIHLIDCLEQHDDIFAEEDKIFLDEFLNSLTGEYGIEKRLIAKAKELGISKRTAYRWKALGKLKGF